MKDYTRVDRQGVSHSNLVGKHFAGHQMKTTSIKFIPVLIAFATIFSISPARGDEKRCPEWTAPDKPILKQRYKFRGRNGFVGAGPALETTSFYWKRGTWFELPLGYRNPWTTVDASWAAVDREKYISVLSESKSSGYDGKSGQFNSELVTEGAFDTQFAFWMPSLRYVERNLFFTPYYRPCEAGRSPPTQSEYIVKFWINWPFLPNSEASSPAHRFRVFTQRLSNGKKLPMQGVKRFEHNLDGSISGYAPYKLYYDDGDLAVYLTCSAYLGREKPFQPLCNGKAWKRSLDLILHLRFPSEKGQEGNVALWKPLIGAAIAFAVNWRS